MQLAKGRGAAEVILTGSDGLGSGSMCSACLGNSSVGALLPFCQLGLCGKTIVTLSVLFQQAALGVGDPVVTLIALLDDGYRLSIRLENRQWLASCWRCP